MYKDVQREQLLPDFVGPRTTKASRTEEERVEFARSCSGVRYLVKMLILALWNHWLPGDAAHVRQRRSHGRRVL